MTVVLALRHRGGLVLASDSQATFLTASQPTRDYLLKLSVLGEHALGWGTSGETGLIARIQHALEEKMPEIQKAFKLRTPEDGLRRIQEVMNPLQQQALKEFVNVPGRQAAQAAAIFVGHSKGKPFLAAIETSGAYGFSSLPYFAIGSGDIFALHAMRSVAHFPLEQLDQGQALALAYRTIENTIAAAAIGVGGSVQLLAATPERIWCLNDEEVRGVQDAVNLWKKQEIEVLGGLAGSANHGEGAQAGPAAADPPREA